MTDKNNQTIQEDKKDEVQDSQSQDNQNDGKVDNTKENNSQDYDNFVDSLAASGEIKVVDRDNNVFQFANASDDAQSTHNLKK